MNRPIIVEIVYAASNPQVIQTSKTKEIYKNNSCS